MRPIGLIASTCLPATSPIGMPISSAPMATRLKFVLRLRNQWMPAHAAATAASVASVGQVNSMMGMPFRCGVGRGAFPNYIFTTGLNHVCRAGWPYRAMLSALRATPRSSGGEARTPVLGLAADAVAVAIEVEHVGADDRDGAVDVVGSVS